MIKKSIHEPLCIYKKVATKDLKAKQTLWLVKTCTQVKQCISQWGKKTPNTHNISDTGSLHSVLLLASVEDTCCWPHQFCFSPLLWRNPMVYKQNLISWIHKLHLWHSSKVSTLDWEIIESYNVVRQLSFTPRVYANTPLMYREQTT